MTISKKRGAFKNNFLYLNIFIIIMIFPVLMEPHIFANPDPIHSQCCESTGSDSSTLYNLKNVPYLRPTRSQKHRIQLLPSREELFHNNNKHQHTRRQLRQTRQRAAHKPNMLSIKYIQLSWETNFA